MHSIKQSLLQARALLADGWIKGGYQDDKNCYCLVGAVCKVTNTDPEYLSDNNNPEAMAVLRRIQLGLGWSYMGMHPAAAVVAFNDMDETQKSDVLALLDKVLGKI